MFVLQYKFSIWYKLVSIFYCYNFNYNLAMHFQYVMLFSTSSIFFSTLFPHLMSCANPTKFLLKTCLSSRIQYRTCSYSCRALMYYARAFHIQNTSIKSIVSHHVWRIFSKEFMQNINMSWIYRLKFKFF